MDDSFIQTAIFLEDLYDEKGPENYRQEGVCWHLDGLFEKDYEFFEDVEDFFSKMKFDKFPDFSGDDLYPVDGPKEYAGDDLWKNPKRLQFAKWLAGQFRQEAEKR